MKLVMQELGSLQIRVPGPTNSNASLRKFIHIYGISKERMSETWEFVDDAGQDTTTVEQMLS